MKIINWNVGRPSKNKGEKILEKLTKLNADLLILTETNSSIVPQGKYQLASTEPLPKGFEGIDYKDGEIRTAIWTKYPIETRYPTFDVYTSICTDIETPFGLLTVYATIVGVLNGTNKRFKKDLAGQLHDFNNLFPGKQVCIVGDYNITFSGHPYPSLSARQTLNDVFQKFKMINLTSDIVDSVDHIAINSEFMWNKRVALEVWNEDKKLSDHIGVCATITEQL